MLRYQRGDCLDEKRLFGRYLQGDKLGVREAEFIFFDRCFAAAESCSAHGVWESVWESDTVNNLLFKAVAIKGVIRKLPHGNLKSPGDRLRNQS